MGRLKLTKEAARRIVEAGTETRTSTRQTVKRPVRGRQIEIVEEEPEPTTIEIQKSEDNQNDYWTKPKTLKTRFKHFVAKYSDAYVSLYVAPKFDVCGEYVSSLSISCDSSSFLSARYSAQTTNDSDLGSLSGLNIEFSVDDGKFLSKLVENVPAIVDACFQNFEVVDEKYRPTIYVRSAGVGTFAGEVVLGSRTAASDLAFYQCEITDVEGSVVITPKILLCCHDTTLVSTISFDSDDFKYEKGVVKAKEKGLVLYNSSATGRVKVVVDVNYDELTKKYLPTFKYLGIVDLN